MGNDNKKNDDAAQVTKMTFTKKSYLLGALWAATVIIFALLTFVCTKNVNDSGDSITTALANISTTIADIKQDLNTVSSLHQDIGDLHKLVTKNYTDLMSRLINYNMADMTDAELALAYNKSQIISEVKNIFLSVDNDDFKYRASIENLVGLLDGLFTKEYQGKIDDMALTRPTSKLLIINSINDYCNSTKVGYSSSQLFGIINVKTQVGPDYTEALNDIKNSVIQNNFIRAEGAAMHFPDNKFLVNIVKILNHRKEFFNFFNALIAMVEQLEVEQLESNSSS